MRSTLSAGLRRIESIRLAGVSIAALFVGAHAAAQDLSWGVQLGTRGGDTAQAAAPDDAGGVYVAGGSTGDLGGTSAGSLDAYVARFDGTGLQLWLKQFGTGEIDYAQAVASDGSGGAYVSGVTFGSLGGIALGFADVWIAHFDATGNPGWTRQFGTPEHEIVQGAAADAAGGVFLTGATQGDLGALNAGRFDAWVARFDASGALLWIRQWGSPSDEFGASAAPDGQGGLYVAGYTSNDPASASGGRVHAWLARFDEDGNRLWLRRVGAGTHGIAGALTTAPDGDVLVAGSYVVGSLPSGEAVDFDAWLARHDRDGNELWLRSFGSSDVDQTYAIAGDGSGGAVVGGTTRGDLGGPGTGTFDAWLARFDEAGLPLWTEKLATPGSDSVEGLAGVGSGNVLATGYTFGSLFGPNAGSSDIWLARYDGSCNSGTTYCVASSTSIAGCAASISATGSPTLSNPTAWTISSGPVPGANLGLLLFGSSGKDNTPYGTLGGKLCVAAPTFRSAPKSSGGDVGQCNGSYTFTLADLIAASPIVQSGATINAQVWARDPGNADGFLLSDGLELVVCP